MQALASKDVGGEYVRDAAWLPHFYDSRRDSLTFAYLPPYAPQANPVEFLWAHAKGRDLANYVPDTKVELGEHLVQTLRRTRRRSDVLEGCFHAAGLKL